MKTTSLHLALAVSALAMSGAALAKLPPLSEEAKAKAAEAAAKTAHGNKLANFQLCQSMDKVAAGYYANAKKAGKETKPAATTAPCENPGPFVYTPPAPAGAASAATSVAAAAAPATATAGAPPAAPAPAPTATKK
jgi:hypothetical protein